MNNKITLNFIWFRNDLRLSYNKIAQLYSESKLTPIPIFLLDPRLIGNNRQYSKRLLFLYKALFSLQSDLRSMGSDLLIYKSNPISFWDQISDYFPVQIHASKDYSSFSKTRDSEVQSVLELKSNNSELILVKNLVILDYEDGILTKQGKAFKVFTSFKKEWLKSLKRIWLNFEKSNDYVPKFASAADLNNLINQLKNKLGIKPINLENILQEYKDDNINIIPGETEAKKKWSKFFKTQIYDYSQNRNRFDLNSTSRLSPYLKFGNISPHKIALNCIKEIEKHGLDFSDYKTLHTKDLAGIEAYLSEIIWREFYKYILDQFPFVEKESFQSKYRKIKWTNDLSKFEAWCKGNTGYPIVDACMRQLNSEGWMHNRGRMIVGSFLCKDLHIDWKLGEQYFKEKLIDYDLSANNGGWQWVAGVGTDAAPYFRIFNPVEQGKKYDPKGDFVKKYLPELANLPEKYIHCPWKMSPAEQEKLAITIGKDYPLPITDHAEARKKTLELYKFLK